MRAPFPWFGGKSTVADLVWQRFGDVPNYVEPFAGSLAVLLARPSAPRIETVNDLNGYLCNFWRSVQRDPKTTAEWASWPVSECDLIARHKWLRENPIDRILKDDPDFYDPKIAGWWVWGLCSWIGSGWCESSAEQLPYLADAGRGVTKKLPHLGDAGQADALIEWFSELSARLLRVRIACGEWDRVTTPSVTFRHGVTGVFLDPPYSTDICDDVYRMEPCSAAVAKWAIENGSNPLLRIALCGYEGEHEMPENWACVPWKANGGMSKQGTRAEKNAGRERIWFSPNCLGASLFCEAL